MVTNLQGTWRLGVICFHWLTFMYITDAVWRIYQRSLQQINRYYIFHIPYCVVLMLALNPGKRN